MTNVEVYQFLSKQQKEYQKKNRKGPETFEVLRKDVLQYFETHPNPLSQKPLPFDTTALPTMMKKLRPYQISKGELIMIFNIRPTSTAALNVVLENMEDRFSPETQEEILGVITEVLGQFPQEPEENGQEDSPA